MPKTILMVDDEKTICALFSAMLIAEGFKVRSAYSGKDALDVIKANPPDHFDLIILDMMMPGYGGYEVLKELQQGDYKDIPIFIMTARQLDTGSIRMLQSESNVREFWTKPVDTKKFKSRVHFLLDTAPDPEAGKEDIWERRT